MTLHPIEVVILPDGRMDRKNAALYLGLAVKTLAMHATRGTGPSFIKRGRVFYFRDDLDNWLRDPPSGGSRRSRRPTGGRVFPPSDPPRKPRMGSSGDERALQRKHRPPRPVESDARPGAAPRKRA
jgi:hypothetical protein